MSLIDVERARKLMARRGFDAIIACSPENFYYVSGFQDPYIYVIRSNMAFAVLPRDGEPVLIVNHAERELARKSSWIKEHVYYESEMYTERKEKIHLASSPINALKEVLYEKKLRGRVIGIDKSRLLVSQFEELSRVLKVFTLVDCTDFFYELRSVKTKEEAKLIREATRITEKGVKTFLENVREGITELDLKREVELAVIREGGEIHAHHPCHITLGAGKNSAIATAPPSEYRLKQGDIVRIDLGATYKGYTSDIARVAAIGDPSEKIKKLYNVLREAQQNVINSIKPGVRASELFWIGVNTVKKHGYTKYMRGLIGHGLGLEVHEPPYISPNDNTILQPGMIIAIEIPYYIEEVAGLNIEDVCLVTESGYEILSTLDKELHIC